MSEVSNRRRNGKNEIEAVFQAVFEAARKGKSSPPYLNIQPKDLKTQMLNDAVVVTFHFDRDETSFSRRTIVFQKQNGKWLIVHLHASNAALGPMSDR